MEAIADGSVANVGSRLQQCGRCLQALHQHIRTRLVVGDWIPETTISGRRGLTPWLIEAPLNSVELLEAVLKPSQPFKIYKAHHVSQPPITDMPPKPVKKDYWSETDAF
ncbi:hypothetical protein F4801DRAFT_577528 [Xylaria longipes]|nr:hypothetical protein F4801DRAFT_577528 [Xylaria longipes]